MPNGVGCQLGARMPDDLAKMSEKENADILGDEAAAQLARDDGLARAGWGHQEQLSPPRSNVPFDLGDGVLLELVEDDHDTSSILRPVSRSAHSRSATPRCRIRSTNSRARLMSTRISLSARRPPCSPSSGDMTRSSCLTGFGNGWLRPAFLAGLLADCAPP